MKRIIILSASLLLGFGIVSAQNNGTDSTTIKSAQPIQHSTDSTAEEPIFIVTEKGAEFPGGYKSMFQFIGQNLHYPQLAIENDLQGKVILSFVVEKDGTLTNVKVLRDIGGGCAQEAVRVVKLMPRWTPAEQNGKPVRSQFNLPINFQIQDSEKVLLIETDPAEKHKNKIYRFLNRIFSR